MTYENKCPICGRLVPFLGRGRPALYHPKCRKIEQLFSWLEDLLIDAKPDSVEHQNKLRSRLWYLANLLNSKNRKGACL
jgi:hypothetical protein